MELNCSLPCFYIVNTTNELYKCILHEKTNKIEIKNEWTKLYDVFSYSKLIQTNGLWMFLLINELNVSSKFKSLVIQQIIRSEQPIVVKINPIKKEFIDYTWNYMVTSTIWQAIELENTMSWLSTLGGAFSALGDNLDKCAIIAGKISMEQLRLAINCGDPTTVARCKLYFSISLIQQGKLRTAKYLIRRQYGFAKSQTVIDHRVIKMCQGIWMKLQYAYLLRRQNKLTNIK